MQLRLKTLDIDIPDWKVKMTYEYKCLSCLHEWEHEAKITEEPLKTCPKCKKESAQRQVSGGTGHICKVSGWFNSGGY